MSLFGLLSSRDDASMICEECGAHIPLDEIDPDVFDGDDPVLCSLCQPDAEE